MNLLEKYSKKYKECNTKLTVEPESSPADDSEYFDERAAIMEYDGVLTREEAENEAAILTKENNNHSVAAKIYSEILNDKVWVVSHPDATTLIPKGEVYYLPEEIQGLRGALPKDIVMIHLIKKELCGTLIAKKS